MPSIAERIAAATLTALSGAIPAVGTRVFRARVDALPNSECPAIVISSGAEESTVATLAADVMLCEFDLLISIHVAGGDVWETVADLVAVPAHALFAALNLPGGATTWVGPLITDDAASGDDVPAMRTLTYTITHYRQAAALDAAA